MESARISTTALLEQLGQLVIDGSMATALEQLGAELRPGLWTASALLECPEKVKAVHYGYLAAGADCGITCSYQATLPGLMRAGLSLPQAEEVLCLSVRLFQEARAQWWQDTGAAAGRAWPLCLASVGPYGAYLADGSEYRGHYGVPDETLRAFHRRRMELLWRSGADALLLETQPSLREALIAAELAEELGADYWVSFSCRDSAHTAEGTPIDECARAFAAGHPHLKMIGVNCTSPRNAEQLVRRLRRTASVPIAAYPNSGAVYDPAAKSWRGGEQSLRFRDWALALYRAGADAVGGCCTTTVQHVRETALAREDFRRAGCRRILSY